LTALRIATGALLTGHGLQKLVGWFDGNGLEATGTAFEQHMGLRPGRPHAVAAGVTETAGGVATMLGLWTPAAAAATTGVMTVAIGAVHGRNGPWLAKGGYEYNATLLAVAFALAAAGPGRLALDGNLTRRRSGAGWAVAQLALGAAAGVGVLAAARRRPAAEPPPAETPPADTPPAGTP
jgi:putative oxidoreductase